MGGVPVATARGVRRDLQGSIATLSGERPRWQIQHLDVMNVLGRIDGPPSEDASVEREVEYRGRILRGSEMPPADHQRGRFIPSSDVSR
jgi:hypothetical protein